MSVDVSYFHRSDVVSVVSRRIGGPWRRVVVVSLDTGHRSCLCLPTTQSSLKSPVLVFCRYGGTTWCLNSRKGSKRVVVYLGSLRTHRDSLSRGQDWLHLKGRSGHVMCESKPKFTYLSFTFCLTQRLRRDSTVLRMTGSLFITMSRESRFRHRHVLLVPCGSGSWASDPSRASLLPTLFSDVSRTPDSDLPTQLYHRSLFVRSVSLIVSVSLLSLVLCNCMSVSCLVHILPPGYF